MEPLFDESDHERIRHFIESDIGVQLPPSKQELVEGRLRRRVKKLKFKTFSAYLDWALDSPEGHCEKTHIINAITTHKTFFFREPEQFEFLNSDVIDALEERRVVEKRDKLRFWSAGCSTGEEAYTLAMVLNERAEKKRNLAFHILASDVSNVCISMGE